MAANDPFLWLEGVTDPQALAWVRERNAKTRGELASGELASGAEFATLRVCLLRVWLRHR